jgi:alpha-L-fucosidase
MNSCFSLTAVVLLFSSCGSNETYYERSVTFSPGYTMEEKVELASRVVPSDKQLEWQKLEMTAFIHFGINTFTGREWGDGREDPALFNPTELDAEQWVKTLHDAGMKLVIITAKHHDGFCLWPTETTDHSVASSPWKNGEGDVVKELKEACEKYNMKFGVYLSPWDQNTAVYGTDEYNDFFIAQLTELLTNYGKVDEVWFDGANGEGPNGKRQVYDWEAYYNVINELQPEAVTAIMGEDVRWVGTETGYGRETEWSVTPLAPGGAEESVQIKQALKLGAKSEDLGSRELIKEVDQLFWFPAEVDVSIRPGWFYHPEQDNQVKSLAKLVDIYFNSVGMNAVLLLNIPPDKRGLIHENDVEALRQLRAYLDEMHQQNYATIQDHAALYDDDYDSYVTVSEIPGELVLEFPEKRTFNVVELQEYIPMGQRVEDFSLMVMTDDGWEEAVRSTTIGYKKLKRMNRMTTDKVKLVIHKSRGEVKLNSFALYQAPDILTDPFITRNKEGVVSIKTEFPGPEIYYTVNGNEPTPEDQRYEVPFELKKGGIIKAKAFIKNNTTSSQVITKEFDIAPVGWRLMGYSDQHPSHPASYAIDGVEETMWHTPWGKEAVAGHPHHIEVDMNEEYRLKGFRYNPRTSKNKSGTILSYNFLISNDGKNWKKVDSGSFSNMKNNPIEQKVYFKSPVTARYFRFESIRGIYDEKWVSVGEVGVLTTENSSMHN